jgi:hypothetical protein
MKNEIELIKDMLELIEFHELHVTDIAAVDVMLRADKVLQDWKEGSEENAAWFKKLEQDNMHELT